MIVTFREGSAVVKYLDDIPAGHQQDMCIDLWRGQSLHKRTMNDQAINDQNCKCSARRAMYSVLTIVLATSRVVLVAIIGKRPYSDACCLLGDVFDSLGLFDDTPDDMKCRRARLTLEDVRRLCGMLCSSCRHGAEEFGTNRTRALRNNEQSGKKNLNKGFACLRYLRKALLSMRVCRYVLSGCVPASIFVTFRHHEPTISWAQVCLPISQSARLVAINAVLCCIPW